MNRLDVFGDPCLLLLAAAIWQSGLFWLEFSFRAGCVGGVFLCERLQQECWGRSTFDIAGGPQAGLLMWLVPLLVVVPNVGQMALSMYHFYYWLGPIPTIVFSLIAFALAVGCLIALGWIRRGRAAPEARGDKQGRMMIEDGVKMLTMLVMGMQLFHIVPILSQLKLFTQPETF